MYRSVYPTYWDLTCFAFLIHTAFVRISKRFHDSPVFDLVRPCI